MEIVSSALSQPVVPIVELSSDNEMDKPHESNDDDDEESGSVCTNRDQAPEAAVRGRHQGREGPLAGGGGEASETDCAEELLMKPRRRR